MLEGLPEQGVLSWPCSGCGSHGVVVWFSSVCICYCTFFSLITVYPFGSCFKSGFSGLCGWSFFSFIHCFGLRACCCLRAEISASVILYCSVALALLYSPLGFFSAMKDDEACSKKNKKSHHHKIYNHD
jgi:hypothetical protein